MHRKRNYHFSSGAQSYPTLCDPMDCSMPGFPIHHQLPELAQTHINWVGDAIQRSHPLLFPSPPTFNLSQHQGLFQWFSSSHQVAKTLELQLQHQPFTEYSGLISFRMDWLDLLVSAPWDSEDGGVERRALIFSLENSKTATNRWTTIDRRMVDPTKKVQGQGRCPNKTVGGTKSCLEAKRSYKQGEETTLRMRGNNGKWNNQKRINFHNTQAVQKTQYQEKKNVDKRP